MKLIIFILLLTQTLQASNWKEVFRKDSIVVYAMQGDNAIIPFKAEGELNQPIEKVLAALKDLNTKPKWSPKLKNVELHKKIDEQNYIFSEFYKTPWPATDREFLLKGNIEFLSKKLIKLSASSINDETLADSSHIQADVKQLDLVLTKITDSKTKIVFIFNGDLKGWMPNWLTNLIQKKWPYKFILGLREHLKK